MITQKGADLVFESLKDSDGKIFEFGSGGKITLDLAECPCTHSIGVKFSGHINLAGCGIHIPNEAEDSLADAILHVVWEEIEARKRGPNAAS